MTWGARLPGIHMAVYDTYIYNYQIYSNKIIHVTRNLLRSNCWDYSKSNHKAQHDVIHRDFWGKKK